MIKKLLNIVLWIGTALVMRRCRRALAQARNGISTRRTPPGPGWRAWSSTCSDSGRRSSSYFRRRNARYGAIATLSAVIFIAILVAVNYLSVRQNKRWDLTSNRQFTLSDQTDQPAEERGRADDVARVLQPAGGPRSVPQHPR